MPHFLRRAFPYFALGLLAAALAWAVSFGTLPPADFTFDNNTEVETIDPALATGQPENRIINGLFEGLLRHMPAEDWETKSDPHENVEMTPQPAMAELPEISADGKTYTFRIRRGMKWSDDSDVTAEDFAWSWMRMLHPETGSKYAYQLYYVAGAKAYNAAQVEIGGQVEVELVRPDRLQLFPRGQIVRGVLRSIHKPPAPSIPKTANEDARSRAESKWKAGWVYVVAVGGIEKAFAKDPAAAGRVELSPPLPLVGDVQACMQVLPDFDTTVGIRTPSPDRLIVTLNSPTAYFSDLVAFYPLYPVHRKCIETHGSPRWTKPENLVSNGPFTLQFRRIRDRIRLAKNPLYWDAARVKLNVIDALATKSETTSLNMYMNGQLDWATVLPTSTIPKMRKRYPAEFYSAPMLTTYFYRINVTRPDLSDPHVRRALGMAIDKARICELITRAGEVPAGALDPPGLAGYASPAGLKFDVPAAQKLLAEAGYPGGRGLPKMEILYNDMDAHRTIAETIQQMWKEKLGVDVESRGLEWGVYLDSQHKLDYKVSRSAWVADYADPNTFLDMFVKDGENNQTGWSNAAYDKLIADAGAEPDVPKRMQMLREAEQILLHEAQILPIYFYVSKNLVRPRIRGFFCNVQDEHPLKLIEVVR